MYVTEKEASTKWCPEVRIAGDQGPSHNRTYPNKQTRLIDTNHCCLGSTCMQWRWKTNEAIKPFHFPHPNAKASRPDFDSQETKLLFKEVCKANGVPDYAMVFHPFEPNEAGSIAFFIECEAAVDERRTGFCGKAPMG